MAWPETKGDKAFAIFWALFVVLAILMGFENSARSRCEDALTALWEEIYSEFGKGFQEKLSHRFSVAHHYCKKSPYW